MRTYYIEDLGTCFFNTAKFIDLFHKEYGPGVKEGCLEIAKRMNQLDELCKENNWKRISSWLKINPRTGKYSVPNDDHVIDLLAKTFQKVSVKKTDLIIKEASVNVARISEKDIDEVIKSSAEDILIKVVMSYADSDAYNINPKNAEADGKDYWEEIIDIAKGKIEKSEDSRDIKTKRLNLCEDIKKFVMSYEYSDGLSEDLCLANQRLRYFSPSFEIIDESLDLYVQNYGLFRFHPTSADIIDRYKYYEEKKMNFPEYSEEDLFMRELADTVSAIYRSI